MAEYFIDTAGGPRGPYSEDKIIEGVKSGKIPTGARIRNGETNETMRAVDLTGQPADSGSYAPPAEYRAEGQHRQQYQQQRPVSAPQPVQNYYQQPQHPQYPQQQYPQAYQQQGHGYQQRPYSNQMPYGHQSPYPVARQTSGLAIASLITSCVSIMFCPATPVIAIAGIVLGVFGLRECEPNGPRLGRGMALAGIWVGVGLTVVTLGLVVLVIAAGGL